MTATTSAQMEPQNIQKTEDQKPSFDEVVSQDHKGDSMEFKDPYEPNPKIPISLVSLIGWDWIWELIGIFFALGAGIGTPMFYIVFQELVDVVVPAPGAPSPTNDSLYTAIEAIALKMVWVAVGLGLAEGLKEGFVSFASHRFEYRIKSAFFKSLINQEMGYFDMKKTGAILSHLSEDVSTVVESWTATLAKVFQFSSQVVVAMVLSFRASWLQTLFMLCIVPTMLILVVIGLFIMWTAKLSSSAAARSLAAATEVIGGMKTVRSMSGEEKEKKRFSKHLNRLILASVLKSTGTGTAMGIGHFIVWGGVAFGFFIGGILITDGIGGHKISVGKMFEVFGVSLMAVIGIAQAAAELALLMKSIASANQVLKIIERKPQIKPHGGLRIPSDELKGRIVFENVSFAYPSRPDVVVLKDFSLTIEPGESVALVGESGSGKSTITNLIEKFYVPISGKIYVDGYDLMDIDPRWWRRTIGIVTQEPVLFNMTIADNIKYACIHGFSSDRFLTDEEVSEAATKANAHNFISDLKDKYKTIVGERGVGLSGGQKQRIAIARLCASHPKVLLLDEATSALDNESETLVQDALNKLMKGRTTVTIAHRLSTVVDSDKIVVMSKGTIVEIGTHRSLLEKGGVYATLASRQMMSVDSMAGLDEEENL